MEAGQSDLSSLLFGVDLHRQGCIQFMDSGD